MVKCVLVTSLFAWCISGVPHLFDGKHVLVTSLFVWLMVYLMCAHDKFAHVGYF